MRLLHAADIHLGRRRLDGRLPDKDLAQAFAFVAQAAVKEKVDAFLLAGDLFDRAQVEPPHLRQAQQVLQQLKNAGIPVLAIEGNHDKAFLHSAEATWLDYLAEDELLFLLRTPFDASGPKLAAWDSARKTGSWLDLGGVRFVGAGYLGAATPHKVRELVARLEPSRTHVLLLHAGPEYFVGEGGGFSTDDLKLIHERVCYLALGHIHKPMRHGDWACNPGSLENCDLREAALSGPRGYALVEIDPERREQPLSLEIRDNPRRPCHRLTLDCTPFGNKLKNGAAALVEAAVKEVQGVSHDAVVELRLVGKLNLDRIALDPAGASAAIERAAGVCAVALDLSGLNAEGVVTAGAAEPEPLSREDFERKSIRELVDSENLWGLDGRQPEFAALFYELKEAVKAGQTAEEVAERVARSPLVDAIRLSLAEAQPPANPPELPTPKPAELFNEPVVTAVAGV